MKTRILLFEDEHAVRRPICTFLRANGYEVLDFPSPVNCALVSHILCACPRDCACADLLITDMQMPGMTGLALIRMLAEKGCRAAPNNKIVISSSITPEQDVELRAFGCQYLPKPFQLDELLRLVEACKKKISPDRKLVPLEELWKTISNSPDVP